VAEKEAPNLQASKKERVWREGTKKSSTLRVVSSKLDVDEMLLRTTTRSTVVESRERARQKAMNFDERKGDFNGTQKSTDNSQQGLGCVPKGYGFGECRR
jgi:hypothetical protein